jgi:uncharacterized protein involved in exopolysaccharide biosynthesis
VELYQIDKGDSGKDLDAAILKLRDEVLSIGVNRQTAIVRIRVTSEWPEVSMQIAQMIMMQVNGFLLSSRQSAARSESDFIESRILAAASDLRASEDALESFLQRNRAFGSDPRLQFQHDRLQREVAMKQQILTMLQQNHAQARIEAVRNTPSISIVEQPTYPLRADRRRALQKVVFAFIATLIVLLAAILARFSFASTDKAAAAELRAAWFNTSSRWRGLVSRFLHRAPSQA